MRIFSTASVSNVAGQLTILTGYQPFELISNLTSPNSMLSFGQQVKRFGLETTEVKHAPGTNSSIFRPVDFAVDQGGNCFNVGVPATSATSVAPSASQTSGIGFAWSGLTNTLSGDLIIELVKIIEWTPDATANISQTQAPPRPTASYEDIQCAVQSQEPDWQTKMFDTMSNMAGAAGDAAANRIINTAWTAAGLYATNHVRRNILVPAF